MNERRNFMYTLFYDHIKCHQKSCYKKYIKTKFGVKNIDLDQTKPLKSYRNKMRVNNKFYLCSGCFMVFYCSKRCQKLDWNKGGHKQFCKNVQQKLHV